MERTAEGHVKLKPAPLRPEPQAPLTTGQRLQALEKQVVALKEQVRVLGDKVRVLGRGRI